MVNSVPKPSSYLCLQIPPPLVPALLCSTPKMQTLEIEDVGEEQGCKDQIITQKTTKSAEEISNQSEMMEEILSRLPVKTLVQFSCVSKPWRSLISDQSFVKLHSNRTNQHGLVISAFNESNAERYFLFVSHNGGPINHVLTIPGSETYSMGYGNFKVAQHVNGLLLFSPTGGFAGKCIAFVYNPSTRKIFKVPPRDDLSDVMKISNFYVLGFNESISEHMILNIRMICVNFNAIGVEIEIFSLSTYSWRKIDVNFPVYLYAHELFFWENHGSRSVCTNNVICFELPESRRILTFDLISETFSTMNFPPVPARGRAHLMTISGFLGVTDHEHIVDRNKIEVWILEDYKNQVWVKETITLPDCWISADVTPYRILDGTRSCEIVFKSDRVSTDVLSIPIYDMKKGTFTSVEVNLTHELLCSEKLSINEYRIWSYVENMIPLKNSTEAVPFISAKGITKKVSQIPKSSTARIRFRLVE